MKESTKRRQLLKKKLYAMIEQVWIEHDMDRSRMASHKDMARELFDKMGLSMIPGHSKAECVVAKFYGETLVPKYANVQAHKPKPNKPRPAPGNDAKKEFYSSWPWRTLRMKVLKEHGSACLCCGATPKHKDMNGDPVVIVVDHIKPLHTHWHLRLYRSNLQPLCQECNMGKGAWDKTDYRQPEAPDEWLESPDEIPEALRDQLRYVN